MKGVFFLLNAAFAMTILDIILRVHLVLCIIMLRKYLKYSTLSSCLWSLIICNWDMVPAMFSLPWLFPHSFPFHSIFPNSTSGFNVREFLLPLPWLTLMLFPQPQSLKWFHSTHTHTSCGCYGCSIIVVHCFAFNTVYISADMWPQQTNQYKMTTSRTEPKRLCRQEIILSARPWPTVTLHSWKCDIYIYILIAFDIYIKSYKKRPVPVHAMKAYRGSRGITPLIICTGSI